ncbi:MAG TPA: hypothetical protein VGO07_02580 [Candidatus Saccharimonadales bacterium]|nr:hypothetical protein [Candidatus Saccharimonadales bacterium]
MELTPIDYDLLEMTAEDPDDSDEFKEFEQDFSATAITAGEPGMAEVYLPPVSDKDTMPEVSAEVDDAPAAAASAGTAPVEDRAGRSGGEVYVTWDWLRAHGPSPSEDLPPASSGGAGGGGDIPGPPLPPGADVPAADEPEDSGEQYRMPQDAPLPPEEVEEIIVQQPVDTFGWYKGPTMEIPAARKPDPPFMFDPARGGQESDVPPNGPVAETIPEGAAPGIGAAAVEATVEPVVEHSALTEPLMPSVPTPQPKVFDKLYAEYVQGRFSTDTSAPQPTEAAVDTAPQDKPDAPAAAIVPFAGTHGDLTRARNVVDVPLPEGPAGPLPARIEASMPPPLPETPSREAAELAARQQQASLKPESSVPTSVLERVLSGLRRMDSATMGQEDPTQKDVVKNVVVDVTAEEIAAAGGDRMAALGEKIVARQRAIEQRPEPQEGTNRE